jgi:chromosome segregation ATPase
MSELEQLRAELTSAQSLISAITQGRNTQQKLIDKLLQDVTAERAHRKNVDAEKETVMTKMKNVETEKEAVGIKMKTVETEMNNLQEEMKTAVKERDDVRAAMNNIQEEMKTAKAFNSSMKARTYSSYYRHPI